MIDINDGYLRRRPRRRPPPVRRVEGAIHIQVGAGQMSYWLTFLSYCWHYGAPRTLEKAYRDIGGTR